MTDSALKTLILVRHAKSDWDAGGRYPVPDIERPLNARGQRDAARMAEWLATKVNAPVTLVSSPARRAKETAQALASQLSEVTLCFEPALYMAEPVTLRTIIEQRNAKCLLLVAHNPGLEEFVRILAPEIEADRQHRKIMPTTGIYAFEYSEIKDRRNLRLLYHQRPKLLT